MENNKRVEMLENEIKLLKNEVKQTLISIREFLMSIKLPIPAEEVAQEEKQSDFEELLHAKDEGGIIPPELPRAPFRRPERMEMDDFVPRRQMVEPPFEAGDIEDDESPETPGDEVLPVDEVPPIDEVPSPETLPQSDEDDLSFQDDSLATPEISELEEQQADIEQPEEEKMKQEGDMNQPIPQVNMLANLIRWVSVAKKEIGSEQLSTFLEVFSVTGCLSAESKEVIQYVASMIAQQTDDPDTVDIWAKLTLELHGILAGGGAPLQMPELAKKEEPLQEDKANSNGNGLKKDKLVKLKLVLPDDNGDEKEFGITLSSDGDGKSY